MTADEKKLNDLLDKAKFYQAPNSIPTFFRKTLGKMEGFKLRRNVIFLSLPELWRTKWYW